MPITLNCPKCHKPFRVRDESIGGKVRCPSCGSVLQVPAALAPASNFDGPAKGDGIVGEATPRPVAEDVAPGSHQGVPPVMALPGSARTTGGHLPGPPSIKTHSASPPAQLVRPSVPVSLPNAPASPRLPRLPAKNVSADEAAWKKVRGGLGMIRWALFLCVLVVLAGFGQCIWIMFDFDRAMDSRRSLLGREGWPLWKEVLVAYTAGLLTPAALLLLVGRLRCGGAPREAHARGLARAAAFFTLIGLAGVASFLGLTFFQLGEKLNLSEAVAERVLYASLYAAIPGAILADLLTLLFIGQIGWALGRPRLQLGIAWFFTYAALLPAGMLIGHLFYPVLRQMQNSMRDYGAPLGDPDSDLAQRATIWGVLMLAAVIVLFLRYAGVAGAARRAIRKLLAGET
jgi:predicted Zn finger-like uncharacterized protein